MAATAAATAATAVAAVARVTAASASAARAAWRWTASSQATTPPSAAQKCLIKDDLHPHSTGRGHSRELTGLEEDSHPHSAGRGHAASSGRGLARARVPSPAVLHPRPEEGLAASAGWAYPPTSALIGPSPSSAHRPSDSSLSPGLPGALSPLHERHTGSQISPLVSRTMLTPPWTRRPLHERSPGPRSGVALFESRSTFAYLPCKYWYTPSPRRSTHTQGGRLSRAASTAFSHRSPAPFDVCTAVVVASVGPQRVGPP